MPKVQAGALKVHYQQAGQGPDLLLVHGLGSDLSGWFWGAMPMLARRFRVTAYDLRGHGLTQRTATGYTTRALAEDLLRLLDTLRLQPAHLLGHSYGGAVVLHAAVLQPSAVRTVVVADGYLPCMEPLRGALADTRARRAASRLRAAGYVLPAGLPRLVTGLLADVIADLDGPAARSQIQELPELIDRWERFRSETSVVPDIWNSELTPGLLSDLRIPVLAVYGEHSSCHASLRGLRQAVPTLHEAPVAGAGHMHPMVKPHALVNAVDCWLRAGETDLPHSTLVKQRPQAR